MARVPKMARAFQNPCFLSVRAKMERACQNGKHWNMWLHSQSTKVHSYLEDQAPFPDDACQHGTRVPKWQTLEHVAPRVPKFGVQTFGTRAIFGTRVPFLARVEGPGAGRVCHMCTVPGVEVLGRDIISCFTATEPRRKASMSLQGGR